MEQSNQESQRDCKLNRLKFSLKFYLRISLFKSMSTIEIIKKDFNEFTETMKHDVTELTHQLQTSEKPLFECVTALSTLSRPGLSNSSSSSLNASTEQTGRVLTQPRKIVFDRLQNELQTLQLSQDTYLNDPSEQHLEEFKKWSESYDPDSQKGAISNLLIENEAMRAIYTQLVLIQKF